MSGIFVAGWGAVSSAGWNVAALRDAIKKDEPLAAQPLERPGSKVSLRVRPVPNPPMRPEFLSHPRLRRSSPITHYAAAAALEAIAPLRAESSANLRIGLVVCVQAGCVRYSCRFLDETFANPATASPLLFPETVYAAPASHVAALLGNIPLACSLVGDPACFLQGVALGVQWLEEDRADACLIIGAEESNWVLGEALRYFDRRSITAAGAGALCLRRDSEKNAPVELAAITDAYTYTARQNRTQSSLTMRAQLVGNASDLLCDGLTGRARADAAEAAAWHDWPGERLSPKRILGEGFMASAAWQCVIACDSVANAGFPAANVSLVGSNQQAMGARFIRSNSGISRLSPNGGAGKLRP
jgi:3-oxoacyl-(acyl-carrier-protein) synthase